MEHITSNPVSHGHSRPRERAAGLRRPGVATSLMGAILVPLVLLAALAFQRVDEQYTRAVAADQLTGDVELVEQLVALRSALFAERLAAEISLEQRRPPDGLLAESDFGAAVLRGPDALMEHTDLALTAIDPARRPVAIGDLAAARSDRSNWSMTADGIEQRFEPIDRQLGASLARRLEAIFRRAIELDDTAIVRSARSLEAATRLAVVSAESLGELSDLWLAEPEQRAVEQSALVSVLTRVELLRSDLAASADPQLAEVARSAMAPPSELTRWDSAAASGALSRPDRPVGEPVEVGLALIDGLDWAVQTAAFPVLVAGTVAEASEIAGERERAAARTTALVALAAIAVSVVSALLFGRWIVRPVRRLTDQAQLVGDGQLDVEPLELEGPPEVVRASQAFNDVLANLVILERTTEALAACDFEDPALAQRLPGRLGASMQRSVEVLSDSILDRQELQLRLEHEATHDALTGLANRSALIAALGRSLSPDVQDPGHDVALLFIDLDGFKRTNDHYGHAVGDELLRRIALRLDRVTSGSAQAARLGGDEFVIVVPAVEHWRTPMALARRVVAEVARPIEIDGQWVTVGACVGVALAGGASWTADGLELLRRADLAVYQAKRRGSGSVVLHEAELDEQTAAREELDAALADALDLDGQLRLEYQPIVDAATGAPRGVEALLRWDRPGHGLVSPMEFVPIAEDSGRITDVDLWVLDMALEQLERWSTMDALDSLGISVNVSGRSLVDPDFVADVADLLGRRSAPGARLTIEVTETVLVTDLALVAQQLATLRGLGIRIAIDDFGTGFTSVAHLRAMEVDEIKIDASFVAQLGDASHGALVEMIQQLARHLGSTTVAEGVEHADQVRLLADIGCEALQGFHIARPMPAADVPGWVRARSRAGSSRAADSSHRHS